MPEPAWGATAGSEPDLASDRRRRRRALGIGGALVIAWALVGTGVVPGALTDPSVPSGVARLLGGMYPPDISWSFFATYLPAVVQTVQMSVAGVAIGLLGAVPLALAGAHNLATHGGLRGGEALYRTARVALSFLRAVPELVWALVFIAAFGLGAVPGVMALAVHGAGVMGKLMSEAIESQDAGPAEAVRSTGAGRLATAAWVLVPQAGRSLVSIGLYQWECNIRTATILGFVGAGGLGQAIDIAMRLFRYEELPGLVALVLVLVWSVDRLSSRLRRDMAV